MATAATLGDGVARALPRPARRFRLPAARLVSALPRWLALLPLGLFTFVMIGPFIWTVVMSFRLTSEINSNPYALPHPLRLDNYAYALLPPKADLVRLASVFGVQPAGVDAWLRS